MLPALYKHPPFLYPSRLASNARAQNSARRTGFWAIWLCISVLVKLVRVPSCPSSEFEFDKKAHAQIQLVVLRTANVHRCDMLIWPFRKEIINRFRQVKFKFKRKA
jgi:hypothetical protein